MTAAAGDALSHALCGDDRKPFCRVLAANHRLPSPPAR